MSDSGSEGTSGKQLTVDFNSNCESLHITLDIYKRILQKAISQTTEDIEKLKNALPIDDQEAVKAVSHKLKGDYDNLRITDMSLIAKQINEIAKVQLDKQKIADLLNDFISYFEQLKTIVERQSDE